MLYLSTFPQKKLLFLLSTALLTTLPQAGRSETAVSPAVLANAEGDRKSEAWPADSRGMTIYGSSAFDAIDGPVRITSFNLRPDGNIPIGAKFGFDNLKLLFSVTPVAPADVSRDFETNVTNAITDPVVVFDQSWIAEAMNPNPPGSDTRPFDFKVELAAPFEFDPADGNLLVDWVFGSPIAGQSAFDREGDVFPDHQTLWAGGANWATASGVFSVPTQFVFEAVPEPTCGAGTLLICLGVVSRQRARRWHCQRRRRCPR